MKEIKQRKYFVIDTVTGKGEDKSYETKEEAEEVLQFIKEVLINKLTKHNFTIVEKDITVKEIEKGDKVHWIINGKIDYNRTDVVTKITKNLWGDIQYLTQEIGGLNRRGQAYLESLALAE